jgi:hypothetical protein
MSKYGEAHLKSEFFFAKVITVKVWKPGLPDFSWSMIPKLEKNVPNEHKMDRMVIKYPKYP